MRACRRSMIFPMAWSLRMPGTRHGSAFDEDFHSRTVSRVATFASRAWIIAVVFVVMTTEAIADRPLTFVEIFDFLLRGFSHLYN